MTINGPDKPEKIFTVSEITQSIKGLLEASFPQVWVEGEISNFFRHQSGHLYLTLKDQACAVRAVMFRSDATKVAFDVEDGLQVICRGRINVYKPRGEYQLLIERMEPKGIGALQLAFEQLKEKLAKEGLFDPESKKKLPLFPKKLGLVTSPRGAAIVDILRTLGRRFANIHILIYPVRVQGEGAGDEIAAGLDYLGALPGMDVLIVGRGGGSMEDLWAFNEEKVARAIYRCPVPVISAVGHEIDFTIADFVADIRASTPSAAGELVVEKEEAFIQSIENLENRLMHLQTLTLQERKQQVQILMHNQAFQNFKIRLLNTAQRVDDLETDAREIINDIRRSIAEKRARATLLEEKTTAMLRAGLQAIGGKWERLSVGLNNLSPLNILKKGYTLCRRRDQELIRTVDEVRPEDELLVSFYKGELDCLVRSVDRDKTLERDS